MLYEACRCGGLPDRQAKMLYSAVYHFGPRWETRRVMRMVIEKGPKGEPDKTQVAVDVKVRVPTLEPDADTLEKLKLFIKEGNPSLEVLRTLDPKRL